MHQTVDDDTIAGIIVFTSAGVWGVLSLFYLYLLKSVLSVYRTQGGVSRVKRVGGMYTHSHHTLTNKNKPHTSTTVCGEDAAGGDCDGGLEQGSAEGAE
jgi:hypothetical protein